MTLVEKAETVRARLGLNRDLPLAEVIAQATVELGIKAQAADLP